MFRATEVAYTNALYLSCVTFGGKKLLSYSDTKFPHFSYAKTVVVCPHVSAVTMY